MAAWWELAIPVSGTLLGALIGTWAQGRNSVRLLRLQNAAAEQANRGRHEHERAMQLLEERRKQYFEFLTLIEEWDNTGGERADEVFAAITRMYFIASPEVLEVVEKLYLTVRDSQHLSGGVVNRFVEAARKDLGVGGQVPKDWAVDREPLEESDDS